MAIQVDTGSDVSVKARSKVKQWRSDWNKFAYEALGARLDKEQRAILESVQHNPRTTVMSGTARGKDFVTAVCCLSFFYMTPRWIGGQMIENTKVFLTAPTARQIENIMTPEWTRLYLNAKRKGINLPGRLVSDDIRTEFEEWFLSGFKADDNSTESWTGLHAANTMFAITEASGISDKIFNAIEGNLQGNSRILLVFNPNVTVGYAAKSQKGDRWAKFRLNSLTAPNVIEKRQVIPGQVDYEWVSDKLENWCTKIVESDVSELHDDFQFEGQWYRPEDIFRIKVLGKFPKVSEDSLIPEIWIELAQQRWKDFHERYGINIDYKSHTGESLILGVDVAGMGRDSSVLAYRFGNIVTHIQKSNSGGKADHMRIAGEVKNELDSNPGSKASIDTIGEGAGVYARLEELGYEGIAISCKYSEKSADEYDEPLTDITGQYKFANMRAYLFWAARDWLNPKNGYKAMLPPGETLKEEATEIRWKFQSDGRIIIEKKEDIIKRLGRSTDEWDAFCNTFYPITDHTPQDLTGVF